MSTSSCFAPKQEIVFNHFEHLVKEIYSCGDKIQKTELTKRLNSFLKICQNARKRRPTSNLDSECDKKKIKLDKVEKKVVLPNELWTKIMNYLPSKDIFGSLCLVNKHFYQLSLDPSSITHLQIENIDTEDTSKKAVNVLKRCKKLIGVSFKDIDPVLWTHFFMKALTKKRCKNLQSLKVLVSLDRNKFQRLNISLPMMKNLRELNTLKVLDLQFVAIKSFEHDVVTEISQMNCLKSLRLSYLKHYEHSYPIDSALVDAIALNCKQLESIELEERSQINSNKFRDSLNNLLEKRQHVLKSFKINGFPDLCSLTTEFATLRPPCNSSLQNLKVCQNLEEFSSTIHAHDFNPISESETLRKLKFTFLYEEEMKIVLSNGMKLPRLKYLSMVTRYDPKLLFQQLSQQFFPLLERLYIHSEKHIWEPSTRLDLGTFKTFIESVPKLKSIQIDGNCVSAMDISNEYLHHIMRDCDIFVIFGKTKTLSIRSRQSNFEDFLQHDSVTFGKYHVMKRNFMKWCESNHGYGY